MIDLILTNPQLTDDLLRLITAISNPPPQTTKQIEEAVRAGFAANFASESAGGSPWPELSIVTIFDRAVHGFPAAHPILVRTGDYRSSFVDSNDPDALSEFFSSGDGWAIEVGSSDSRVEELELGTGRIPARPVTMLDDETNVLAAIEQALIALENNGRP